MCAFNSKAISNSTNWGGRGQKNFQNMTWKRGKKSKDYRVIANTE